MSTQPAAQDGGLDAGETQLAIDAAQMAAMNRLMDSLLHDVRNPLNALSINLDVLVEKLRRDQGEIPPGQEKNLKVMREQIHRVDGVLRQFAEFMAPRDEGQGEVDLSAVVSQALVVLGHEGRRSMVKVRQLVEPQLLLATASLPQVRTLVLQGIFRAILRAGTQGEVDVTLQAQDGLALLRVKDSSTGAEEPLDHVATAVGAIAFGLGGTAVVSGPELSVTLPLHSAAERTRRGAR